MCKYIQMLYLFYIDDTQYHSFFLQRFYLLWRKVDNSENYRVLIETLDCGALRLLGVASMMQLHCKSQTKIKVKKYSEAMELYLRETCENIRWNILYQEK